MSQYVAAGVPEQPRLEVVVSVARTAEDERQAFLAWRQVLQPLAAGASDWAQWCRRRAMRDAWDARWQSTDSDGEQQ